jgi:hypothetical protein
LSTKIAQVLRPLHSPATGPVTLPTEVPQLVAP